MQIKVLGAAGGEVTGSSYLVETADAQVMIDAGMFQGSRHAEDKNVLPEGVDLRRLDALLLTHAHLDHTGRIPLLLKNGYQNTIYATSATLELTNIILQDSAKIQVQDAERKNRYNPENPILPLYGPEDLKSFPSQSKIVALHQSIPIAKGISAKFYEAGHILGSTSIELTVEEKGKRKVIVFSGDLGPYGQPIVRDFESLSYADIVFLESTYGDRDHRPYPETLRELEQIISMAVKNQGKILIPCFAIGRAQQIIYHLAALFFQKKIPLFPVFVDSPMAKEAGKVVMDHPELFDEEAMQWKKEWLKFLNSPYFHSTSSVEDSKRLNSLKGPCAILAGSGMCNAGRITHHLKFNLPDPSTHVLIVGYQSMGTLGRRLVDRVKEVTIHGEPVEVRAQIHTLNGFSAHAGQSDLLKWLSSLAKTASQVILTHGENSQREILASKIAEQYDLHPLTPDLNQVIEV